jgi:hypothetical protein
MAGYEATLTPGELRAADPAVGGHRRFGIAANGGTSVSSIMPGWVG